MIQTVATSLHRITSRNSNTLIALVPTATSTSTCSLRASRSFRHIAQQEEKRVVFESEALREWNTRVFEKLGIPTEDALLAAEVLHISDLRGIESHGVARLKTYYELLKAGKINPRPALKVLRETASTGVLDGDNGLGLVVGPKANKIAMDKAEHVGSGWVSVCNTNHFGIAGYYPLQALKKDMIGLAMTNSTKLVVPLWGAEAMLGTNPIAIAFPGKALPPIVLDMATSAVSYGKIEIASRHNEEIPKDWGVDCNGVPTKDPADIIHRGGNLVPLGTDRERGGHKGYGLSVMCDILCAVLSGANWGPFAPPFTLARHFDADSKQGKVGKGIGHFFGAWRIDGFCDVDEFKEKIDEYRRVFKATKPAQGTSGPILPGDPELEQENNRKENGIPLVLPVVDDLRQIAADLNVPLPEEK